jgi:DNA invertase Pin-like site-specific DNA recombinase
MIRGYCRISKRTQNIERQIRNILKVYPNAKLYIEAYTGTKIKGRKEFEHLLRDVQTGDTIIFDSVSRMARNAEEGTELYFDLFEKGVELIFLKEHYIDTSVYADNIKDRIELTGTDEDELFKGINNYFRKLAKKQILIAFEQAQKEVDDLHQRTKEGIETARQNGKQIGQKQGIKLNVKKKEPIKAEIKNKSKDFEGTYTDKDLIKVLGIARNTYYKYKKELIEELNQ